MKRLAKGFTLIELMIVVAIIGILAAIAIPNFVKYQLRSKFSEGTTNIEGLRKAEEALRQGERKIVMGGAADANYTPGQYWNLTGAALPGGTVGTQKITWTATELTTAQALDWMVEGATYFKYDVATTGGTGSESGIAYMAGGVSDIDGDNVQGMVGLSRPSLDMAVNVTATTLVTGFPGNVGSCTDSGGNTVWSMPCTITSPDVF